ncbi:MAG: hypothetical protein MUE81_15205 [Thermoflexibacter sp.]|jgi:hypothetical protein|nr:hypothetical protein [Thermoflexibacter sp.]
MKKLFGTLTLSFLFVFAFAQEKGKEETPAPKKYGFSVSLNKDVFFGLYPTATGYYSLNDKVDFTFYGTMWSDIPNGSGGFGSWTEFGAGANFKVAGGKLGLNPQIGVLAGTLLSKSARPIFGDGIVPSLTANLATNKVEGQLYFGYYMPLFASNTLPTGQQRNSYTHYWTYLGYKVGIVSFGGHFEQLNQPTGGEKSNINLYTWIGPYVAFTLPNNAILKLTAGANSSGDELRARHDGFYKMQFTFNF